MPDERQTSTREGIAPAPESTIGREAESRQRDALTHAPVESRPDSAMGGTSDADAPADESWGEVYHAAAATEDPDSPPSQVQQDDALEASERLDRLGTEPDEPATDRLGE
jgi:hypothetical protein